MIVIKTLRPIKNHPIITKKNASCKNPASSIVEPINLKAMKQDMLNKNIVKINFITFLLLRILIYTRTDAR